eukprot:scaffold63349_cov27-Phaeocystis_antarctica.AAC.1
MVQGRGGRCVCGCYLVVHVGGDEVRHRDDLRVVLVRLRLLGYAGVRDGYMEPPGRRAAGGRAGAEGGVRTRARTRTAPPSPGPEWLVRG